MSLALLASVVGASISLACVLYLWVHVASMYKGECCAFEALGLDLSVSKCECMFVFLYERLCRVIVWECLPVTV